MFRKMRNRLVLVNMIILSLITITAFAAIYFINYRNVQREIEDKLSVVPAVNVVSSKVVDTELQGTIFGVTQSAALPVDYANSFVIVLNDDGAVIDIVSYIDLPEEAYSKAFSAWTSAPEGRVSLEGRQWQYISLTIFQSEVSYTPSGAQIIKGETQTQITFLDITDSLKSLTGLLITFLIVGVFMLAALFVISFYFANRSIRPIEEMWNKQRQFVTDASHELKTPLSVIHSNMAVVRSDSDATVESQAKWLDYIDSETGRMGRLINDLLYLAKAETASETLSPVDFSALTENALASIEAVIYEKGIRLNYFLAPQGIVMGDGEKLKQVVLVLLDNAVKYTENGGTMGISLSKTKHHVRLNVTNSGSIIPKEELPKIFDRFYRVDPSRSGETAGFGLGLSIAKTIVERCGGEITVESNNDETSFTVILAKYD